MFYSKYNFLFEPNSSQPFKLSRSKIDLFVECPRCFYLDRRLGVKRPGGFPFTLNNAVDFLLKKEFDTHRAAGKAHPLMEQYGIKAVPFQHEKMDQWRHNFEGVQYLHQSTNFLIFGAIDDIWLSNDNELIVVDYKATSVNKEVTLDDEWKVVYKRQMEIYQWLMRHSPDFADHKVSDTGYFVYVNGKTDSQAFDAKLEFDVNVLPYKGDDSWVEDKVTEAYQCLSADVIPESGKNCEYCQYRARARQKEE